MKKKVRGRGISVLEEDDEYFGNYWKETDFAELKLGILAKDAATFQELGEQRPKDIAQYTEFIVKELDELEDMIEDMTGVPRFVIDVDRTSYEYEYDEERYEKIWPALQDHHRKWVADTLAVSDPRSPFSKLPVELMGMIMDFTVEDIDCTWEECGEVTPMIKSIIELRSMCWGELCDQNSVHGLTLLVKFMFTRWVRLRELMVAKYEANEETRKEWQSLKEKGVVPY